MQAISKSFSRLTEDSNLVKKVFIGVVMTFTSIFILPYFLYQGYLMRILRETKDVENNSLPKWNNWGGLIKDGLIGFFLSLLITIPIVIITYIPIIGEMSFTVVIVTQLIGFVASLVLYYIWFALLTVVMRDGISEMFNLHRIGSILKSKEYLIGFLTLFVLGFVAGAILGLFVLVTLGFGALIIPILIVPFNFLIFGLIGLAVTESEQNPTENINNKKSNL